MKIGVSSNVFEHDMWSDFEKQPDLEKRYSSEKPFDLKKIKIKRNFYTWTVFFVWGVIISYCWLYKVFYNYNWKDCSRFWMIS